MTPTVFPISITHIDWKMLTHASAQFDCEPSRPLDAAGVKLIGVKPYPMFLASFGDCENPSQALRRYPSLLEHISLGLIVNMDVCDWFEVLSRIKVDAVFQEPPNVGIVTATIGAWKTFCESLEIGNSTTNIRIFANTIQTIIESLGLSDIWFHQRKKPQTDGTYLLEHK